MGEVAGRCRGGARLGNVYEAPPGRGALPSSQADGYRLISFPLHPFEENTTGRMDENIGSEGLDEQGEGRLQHPPVLSP